MNLEQSYQKKNRCYKRAVRREVTGITLYYEKSTRQEAIKRINEWNSDCAKVEAHAIIIGDKVIQTLPWEYEGKFSECSGDLGRINILIIVSEEEMDSESVYENAIELCAVLCKQYGLKPGTAILPQSLRLKKVPEEVENRIEEVTFNQKKPYRIIVTAGRLNVRKGPSVDTLIIGVVKNGDIFTIDEQGNNWGKIKERQGYINLAYTKRLY